MAETWISARYLTTTGELLLFPDYEVSDLGRVRNNKTNKILNAQCTKYGYYFIRPCINSKKKTCYIHRLVLSSFTDNVDCSLDVNHKDENKDNNTLSNLEWMSHYENMNYGTHNKRVAKSLLNGKGSKSVSQFDLNGNFIREWPSTMEVERVLEIPSSSITKSCKGTYKTAGGFVWKYAD